jgi:hypothetical protein
MSGFLGYTGSNNPKLENYIKSVLPEGYTPCIKDKIQFWYSRQGINLSYFDNGTETGIASGIILQEQKDCFPLTSPDIRPEGHYACLLIKNDTVYLFNDLHGLRDIYYIKDNNSILFSTRIDFITPFLENAEVNLEELSSVWLLPHQLVPGTKIKNISKLGPGGCLTIKDNNISHSRESWLPDFNKHTSPDEFITNLKQATLFPLAKGGKLNLGLSGGIDSRVLLSLLLPQNKDNWGTHTFGDEHLPDVELSQRMTSELGITHYFLQKEEATPSDIINNPFYPLLELTAPVGNIINYSFFKQLSLKGYTIIDGGNGEMFRRALFNKFLLTGKNALLNKDINSIYESLKREKADFFNEDVNKKLKEYCLKQLEETVEKLPSPKETGIENWIDMFFVKTSFPNYSGPSQNALDTVASAYMPFVQTSVLNAGFGLDFSHRKNGSLFLEIIRQSSQLKKFPLVKDHMYYPFGMGFLSTRIYLKIKKKLGFVYRNNAKPEIVTSLKEYALDKINSEDVLSFELYDKDKVKNLVNGFYLMNKTELLDQVDWWLSFEIWRENLKKKL